jgi:hypothetical protein
MDESEWACPSPSAYSLPADSPAPTPPASPPPAESPDLDPEWADYVAQVDREMAADDDDGDLEHWRPCDEPPSPAESQDSWWASFGQGNEPDALPPGELLVGLTETATRGLGRLSDDELVGVLQATRRQIAREQYKQVLVIAEFGRRQATFEDAARRGLPVGCRPGGFPGEELAIELVTSRVDAGHRIDDAIDLTTRLPMTLAGLATGMIDEARAGWIAMYTRALTPADAARADEILVLAVIDREHRQAGRVIDGGHGFSMGFGLRVAGARRHLEHVGTGSALPVIFWRSSGRAVMVRGGTDAHGRQQQGRRRGTAR